MTTPNPTIEGVGTTLVIGSATLCYVSIQAPGVDGGDKLEASCLDNAEWLTYVLQTLKDVPNVTFRCKFNPADLAAIQAEVNVNQALTMGFSSPLGSILFWGGLKSFVPEEGAIGQPWEATGEINTTNLNASGAETGPAYSA